MTVVDEIALRIKCPFCAAERGQWCVVQPSLHPAVSLHVNRTQDFEEAYALGYTEAEDDLRSLRAACAETGEQA